MTCEPTTTTTTLLTTHYLDEAERLCSQARCSPISALPAGLERHCQGVAAHARAGVDALRLAGSTRSRIARHLGMANTTVMATLSTAVVMAYAVLFLALALRVFRRAAVR